MKFKAHNIIIAIYELSIIMRLNVHFVGIINYYYIDYYLFYKNYFVIILI